MKLSNQYRGLETEELQFLAERAKERTMAERKREEEENADVREYRECVRDPSKTILFLTIRLREWRSERKHSRMRP